MPVETLLHLEKGQRVKPFEGQTEFLPVNLGKLLDIYHSGLHAQEENVLQTGVEFQGIKGMLAAVVSSRLGTYNPQTPLGDAKAEIDYSNGWDEVKSLPVSLSLLFQIESMKHWSDLLSDRAFFELGNERYVVKYHLEAIGMTVGQLQEGLDNFKVLPAIGALYFTETLRPATVVLPYDVARLSQEVNLVMGGSVGRLNPRPKTLG